MGYFFFSSRRRHTRYWRDWSSDVCSSDLATDNISIPLNYKPYLSKENCVKHQKTFKGKSDIAIDFIQSFNKPSNCDKIYCLVDSWYTSQRLIRSEEHTSELQSRKYIVCRLLLEKNY